MSSDIVERLRHMEPRNIGELRLDAADEIERLESQVQMLAGLSRRLLLAGDALDGALEASWQACWCSADDDIASKVATAFNAWQEARRDI